jgi:hypothetical protein
MEWLRGKRECEPVQKFCELVTELPGDIQPQVLLMCGMNLGWRIDPLSASNADNPFTELHRSATLEDLRSRLNLLIIKMNMRAEFLIPALLNQIVDFYQRASLASTTSDAIDHDLQNLKEMEDERQKSPGEREAGMTDEALDHFIKTCKLHMKMRHEQRISAQQAIPVLERLIKDHFPNNYWLDWLHREIEMD